jgi:hypothetical protein
MKILIIGAGTAGAMTASILLYHLQHAEVTTVYTDKISPINVGESTIPIVPQSLYETCKIDLLNDLKHFDGTIKLGLKFIDWNKEDFYHPFAGLTAIHLNSSKFSWYVIEKLQSMYAERYNLLEAKVESMCQNQSNVDVVIDGETHKFDFVIDCGGFPDLSLPEYHKTDFNTMNAVYVYNGAPVNEQFTSHYSHKNGWMFGIPLTNRKAYGYLYNKEITTDEDALADMKNYIPEANINNVRHLKWDSYYRETVSDNRIFYNGNKLVFFEPLQALSLSFYVTMATSIAKCIYHGNPDTFNEWYKEEVQKMLDLLALHYYGNCGKHSDSEFWTRIKKDSGDRLKERNFKQWWESSEPLYAMFTRRDAEYIINGMNIAF